MEKKFFAVLIAFVVVILFGLGGVLSENCVEINGCKSCWKITPVVVTSELCQSDTCLAQPADQQNNAITDVLLCGCDSAKAVEYGDAGMNRKISEVVAQFTGYNVSAEQICEQPGTFLVKRSYE